MSELNESDDDIQVFDDAQVAALTARMRRASVQEPLGRPPTAGHKRNPVALRSDLNRPADKEFGKIRCNGLRIKVGDAVSIQCRATGLPSLYLLSRLFRRTTGGRHRDLVHGQRLTTSTVARDQELFLSHGECMTISARRIQRTEALEVVPFGARRQGNGRFVQSVLTMRGEVVRLGESIPTHCRLVAEPTHNVWRTLRPVPCDSCNSRRQLAVSRGLDYRLGGTSFRVRGQTFRLGHAVLVDSEETGKPFFVGIVKELPRDRHLAASVQIQRLGRVDELKGAEEVFVSERELYLRVGISTRVNVRDILGRARLLADHEQAMLPSTDPAFFITRELRPGRPADISSLVPLSHHIRLKEPSQTDRDFTVFDKSVRPPSADLYSGGGGSVCGASGHFDVKHAVEADLTCCKTLMANFSRTAVRGNAIAEYTARRIAAKDEPGKLALMIAGPPCQGHSGANHHRRADDPRNDELFITLREVERAKPDVFILENVGGFGRDIEDAEGEVVDAASRNFARDAVKGLIAIGYQARVALLDCRAYGSPQNRQRLFVLAARTGISLPDFPKPTHCNPVPCGTRFNVDSNGTQRFYLDIGTVGAAALPAVTASAAISDLPPFEYAGLLNRGRAAPFPSFDARPAKGERVGFVDPVMYACRPRNDFQAAVRSDLGVIDHVTVAQSQRIQAIVRDAFAMTEPSQGSRRRAKPTGGFWTLLTDPAPGGKQTEPIHWEQARVFTVAERKRAQGFPDAYVLAGDVKTQNRQLGNAINVQLMAAVCRQIKRDVYYPFWLANGRPDNRAFWRQWRAAYPV
ncbi:hypothetical protein Q5752_000376 [Cryptotrichosporon argae]